VLIVFIIPGFNSYHLTAQGSIPETATVIYFPGQLFAVTHVAKCCTEVVKIVQEWIKMGWYYKSAA
jgi:hypothetical protein